MEKSVQTALTQLAIEELPAIIGYLRVAFAKRNPDVPAPTDAEVIAAYQSAYRSSVDKDDAWLSSHPF